MRNFLQDQEIDYFVAPCNTFHRYASLIKQATGERLKSIIDIVTNYVAIKTSSTDRVGIIATNNTINSDLYSNSFSSNERKLIYPKKVFQLKAQAGIHYVKSGDRYKAKECFSEVIKHFHTMGIHHIILGCTEVPLGVAKSEYEDITFFDSSKILADETAALMKQYTTSKNR